MKNRPNSRGSADPRASIVGVQVLTLEPQKTFFKKQNFQKGKSGKSREERLEKDLCHVGIDSTRRYKSAG